jgi:ADP-ribose pyrophosphatase YjhB (NUDIX family)
VKASPKSANFKYSRPMTQGIDVTVAAVIEQDGKFLVVEERSKAGKLVINQPAGHLEHGESLINAVIRETLEETGHAFLPSHIVGFYLWRNENGGNTYFRVAFCGHTEAPRGAVTLDEGIVGTHWLTRAQLLNRRPQLRSPMVMRCLDDYLAGRRYPLDCLNHLDPLTLSVSLAARG